MQRATNPLRPPGQIGQQPKEAPQLIPATPQGKQAAEGPLGPRNIDPGLLERLMKAKNAQDSVQMGGTSLTMGLPAAPTPPPEIPEQPSALDHGQPELPPSPETPTPSASGGDMSNMLSAVATTGMEFKANPVLASDGEYMSDIWWLANPERRKKIDAERCQPIDWAGLTTGMQVTQEVLMWTKPTRMVVKFRTVSADDEFLCRKIITDNYNRNDAEGEIGLLTTTAAASLVRLNDQLLPVIPSVLQEPDIDKRKDIMLQRLRIVSGYGMILLRDIVINYAWFVRRVTEAIRKGDLGNG